MRFLSPLYFHLLLAVEIHLVAILQMPGKVQSAIPYQHNSHQKHPPIYLENGSR